MMETGRLCAFFYTGYCEMVSVFSSSYFFGCFGAYEVPLFKKRNGCVRASNYLMMNRPPWIVDNVGDIPVMWSGK